jgi:hypothetical protein
MTLEEAKQKTTRTLFVHINEEAKQDTNRRLGWWQIREDKKDLVELVIVVQNDTIVLATKVEKWETGMIDNVEKRRYSGAHINHAWLGEKIEWNFRRTHTYSQDIKEETD